MCCRKCSAQALWASIAAARGQLDKAHVVGLEVLRLVEPQGGIPEHAMALQCWLDYLIAAARHEAAVKVAACLQHDPRTPAYERRLAVEKLANLRGTMPPGLFDQAYSAGNTDNIEDTIAWLLQQFAPNDDN